jgi:hypothetical protein
MYPPEKTNWLVESQFSLCLTGIDHTVWTAYALVDTDNDTGETVGKYHTMGNSHLRPDPLTTGQLSADDPVQGPREYFLKVFEIRVAIVDKKWHRVTRELQQNVRL